jgi:glycosyltransferase involved in cell wall biosynthesis
MRIDENIFTGTARNQVIKPLESEYIAFIDDDDLWMADKLEKQIAAMQQNELVGFSYTNGYNFSGNKIVEYILHKNTGVDIDNIFISYCLGERGVFLQSLMCRKECFDLAGYFNENRMFTDFSFMGNLAYHYKAAILYEPLLKRRLHEFNSIHSYTASLKDEHFSAIKEYLHKGMLPKKIARQAFFLTHVKTGNALANSGKYLQAIKSYLRGWYVKPFSVIPFKKLMRLSFRYISS